MPVDYSKIPTEDLEALAGGNLKAVSTSTLEMLSGGVSEERKPLSGAGGSFEKEPPTWYEASVSAVKNIPASAVEYGKSMVEPIIHPIETGKALYGLSKGVVQKMTPGEQPEEKNVDALWNAIKDRYGSSEGIKKTMAEDPVGMVADIATLGIPAGKAVQGVGMVSKASRLAKAGETISKASSALEPVTVAKDIAVLPFKLMPDKVPSRLYRSGAKFSTVLTQAQREKLAKTALDNEIMPTVKGLDNLREKIDGLNATITEMIDQSTQTGQRIPIDRLFKEFDDLKTKMLATSGEPIKSEKAFDRIMGQITEANEKLGRTDLSPAEAQKMKQRIYKELDTQYSKMTTRPASVDAQMAVARAAKESLEDILPEIKQLNANEGALLELNKALQRSANRISNRDIMGIGVPIKGSLGGIAGGTGGAAAGLALGILDTPIVKSKIAIVLNRLKKKGVKVSPSAALSRLTARGIDEIVDLTQENNQIE